MTDEEFQNAPHTLRLAPWVDPPRLREALKKRFLEFFSSGEFSKYILEFSEDLREFCEGKRERIPRTESLFGYFNVVVTEVHEEANSDPMLGEAYGYLQGHFFARHQWSYSNRKDDS